MAKATYTNKSGVKLHGVAPGADFVIEVDSEGTPKDKIWRRRLKDSVLDGCIKKQTKKTAKKKGEEV